MKTYAMILVYAALTAGLAGCGNKADQANSMSSLLSAQNELWAQARDVAHTANPDNLDRLSAVMAYMGGRTQEAIGSDYRGANKAELIAKLNVISDAYDKEVMGKLDRNGPHAKLKPGVTIEALRESFDKLDKDYQAFQAMAGK